MTTIVIPLEGNGSRPSHRGDGYGQPGDPMFTLNGTEVHGVCVNDEDDIPEDSSCDIRGRLRNVGGCEMANTLNTFENTDVRATTVVVEEDDYHSNDEHIPGSHD